jgi:hypothetical protein
MNSPSDIREGLSSASSVERDSLCHGAFEAQKDYVDRDSADASRGTLRHDLEENQTPLDDILDDEDRECSRRARASLEHLRDTLKITGSKISREERFWLLNGEGQKLMSGQLDYLEEWNEVALIADYKMLYGVHASAPSNVQLAAYSGLVYLNRDKVKRVYAALIEPFGEPSLTTTVFDEDQLKKIVTDLQSLYTKVYSGTAPRTAGWKQCKFCKALGACPEAAEYITKTIEEYEI